MKEQNFQLDKSRVRRAFDRIALDYDAAAVLQREVGERLENRLDLMRIQPERIMDVGAGTGATSRALMKRYPKARVVALDPAPAMLRRARRRAPWLRRLPCVCADAEALPFNSGSFDLVFSNLALHWCSDPDRAFREFLRVLRPEGLLLFSSYGPDTLSELRASWAAADDYTHIDAFVDMHDLGDALVRARFADPVMDMEYFTLTYDDVDALVQDLRNVGPGNANAGRPHGLTGRMRAKRMREAYEGFRAEDGRLPATYEIVYGHAWVPKQLPQHRDDTGAVRVPVGSIGRRGK